MTNMHMICYACYGDAFTRERTFITVDGELHTIEGEWRCAHCGHHKVICVTTQRLRELRGEDMDVETWEGEGGRYV